MRLDLKEGASKRCLRNTQLDWWRNGEDNAESSDDTGPGDRYIVRCLTFYDGKQSSKPPRRAIEERPR